MLELHHFPYPFPSSKPSWIFLLALFQIMTSYFHYVLLYTYIYTYMGVYIMYVCYIYIQIPKHINTTWSVCIMSLVCVYVFRADHLANWCALPRGKLFSHFQYSLVADMIEASHGPYHGYCCYPCSVHVLTFLEGIISQETPSSYNFSVPYSTESPELWVWVLLYSSAFCLTVIFFNSLYLLQKEVSLMRGKHYIYLWI